MGMAVCEAGKQGRALEIDHAPARRRRGIGSVSDEGDPTVPDHDNLRRRSVVETGVNGAAPDNQVLSRRRRGEERESGEKGVFHADSGRSSVRQPAAYRQLSGITFPPEGEGDKADRQDPPGLPIRASTELVVTA